MASTSKKVVLLSFAASIFSLFIGLGLGNVVFQEMIPLPSSHDRDVVNQRVLTVGDQVLIPVTLTYAGRSTQARLLMDTGATTSVINTGLAERMGIDLNRPKEEEITVAGGGVVSGWSITIDSITAGPHTKSRFPVAVMPDNDGDGILGDGFPAKLHISLRHREGRPQLGSQQKFFLSSVAAPWLDQCRYP